MDYLQNLAVLFWALRWVITFGVILVLIGLCLDARRGRDNARIQARQLVFENVELRGKLARAGARRGASTATRRTGADR